MAAKGGFTTSQAVAVQSEDLEDLIGETLVDRQWLIHDMVVEQLERSAGYVNDTVF